MMRSRAWVSRGAVAATGLATGVGVAISSAVSPSGAVSGAAAYAVGASLLAELGVVLDAGLVISLVLFFELIGGSLQSISAGAPVLWFIVGLPLPFVAIGAIRTPPKVGPWLWIVLGWWLLAGWLAVTLMWSSSPDYGQQKLGELLVRGVIPATYVGVLASRRGISWPLVLWCGAAFAVYTILFGTDSAFTPGRISVSGGGPIWTARAAALVVIVAAFAGGSRSVRFAVIGVSLWAMILTESRGPVLSMLAAVALAVVLHGIFGLSTTGTRGTFLRSVALGGATLTILLVMLLGDGTLFGGRTASIQGLEVDPNAIARLDYAKEAIAVFIANPVGGAGFGSFQAVDPFAMYPHDAALEVAAEAGIVGLGIWGATLVAAFSQTRGAVLPLALLLSAVFFSLTSGSLAGNYETPLFAVAGALMIAPRESRPCE